MNTLLYGFVLMFVSYILVYLYLQYAVKHAILDIPNERSSHVQPTPRGGGLGIVVSWYLLLLFLVSTRKMDSVLFWALLPGLGLAIIGFIDDVFGLSNMFRFIFQLIIAGTAIIVLKGFHLDLSRPGQVIASVIAVFGVIWFINLFNFLDGIDGYAAIEAITISISMWIFTDGNAALLLAFAVAGFLIWNWPKASIFMGDAGSTCLGYTLVVMGIYFHNTHELPFIFWIIITALFWFDATLTLFIRIFKRENLGKAHKNHMYQRAMLGGYSNKQILFFTTGINAFFYWIAYAVFRNDFPLWIGLFIMLTILFALFFHINGKYSFK